MCRVAMSLLAVLLLTGCASMEQAEFDPAVVPVQGPGGAPAEPAVHVGEQVTWGEPVVVPAGLVGPKAVADSDGPYLLDTGDKLRIFVYGQPNLSRLYTVDHTGLITFPLIGAVTARARTTYDVEYAIKARLAREYVKDPHVTVDVQQNRPFFILGEVRNSGQFPYVNGMTVETAVAIAGGFSERASERKFRITRRINGMMEVLDVGADYVVLPGDTVRVFERLF